MIQWWVSESDSFLSLCLSLFPDGKCFHSCSVLPLTVNTTAVLLTVSLYKPLSSPLLSSGVCPQPWELSSGGGGVGGRSTRDTWLAKRQEPLWHDWLWARELWAEFPPYSREHQWAAEWDLLCWRCTPDTFVCFGFSDCDSQRADRRHCTVARTGLINCFWNFLKRYKVSSFYYHIFLYW